MISRAVSLHCNGLQSFRRVRHSVGLVHTTKGFTTAKTKDWYSDCLHKVTYCKIHHLDIYLVNLNLLATSFVEGKMPVSELPPAEETGTN